MILNPSKETLEKNAEGRKVISITNLVNLCKERASKMSTDNPNRNLLENCAYAMTQLVDRLAAYEEKVN